ncbi:sulfate ABC transporter permease subunit CysW [Vibrio ouci]|uniref:Sulfate ABC transporter permease subunit CysW n=2 Tax=Vibrio ouci TaxID=2499078 RepID=A0A4Y8WBG0_9VIBR|nr:sulfate ABC transporter permease subunit CysW [Vibrio ouci]TFH90280.1 sulfate ABC transporter permease subunit CysW [Vibrio ouci]
MTDVMNSEVSVSRPSMYVHAEATTEPLWVQRVCLLVALLYMLLFLFLPLVMVFKQAFEAGWETYLAALREPDALAAIKLTLLVAGISVPLNLLFGVMAAWALTKFHFAGKRILMSLIDLPFTISPVVAGLSLILLFGEFGWFHDWLSVLGIQVVFAVPGIVLATLLVTFPFVARELISLMEAQGSDQEEAGRILGASGWRIFWSVTLPNIRWALFYGVILTNARAMGDFGAVSVVSGHIRGLTNTLPLHIEVVYNEYQFSAAFACASLLALLAIVTLILQSLIEYKQKEGKVSS